MNKKHTISVSVDGRVSACETLNSILRVNVYVSLQRIPSGTINRGASLSETSDLTQETCPSDCVAVNLCAGSRTWLLSRLHSEGEKLSSPVVVCRWFVDWLGLYTQPIVNTGRVFTYGAQHHHSNLDLYGRVQSMLMCRRHDCTHTGSTTAGVVRICTHARMQSHAPCYEMIVIVPRLNTHHSLDLWFKDYCLTTVLCVSCLPPPAPLLCVSPP